MRLLSLIFLLASGFVTVRKMCWCYDLELPNQYTALSDDLQIFLSNFVWEPGSYLELLQLQPNKLAVNATKLSAVRSTSSWRWSPLFSIEIPSSASSERTSLTFPCGVVISGGQFGVRVAGIRDPHNVLRRREKHVAWTTDPNELNIVGLDVRWPDCSISAAPRHIETYPAVQVTALVQFPAIACAPLNQSVVPESWLDLISCGPSLVGCSDTNRSHGQVIYSEQIRGYPRRREVVLRCELFGLAGHYTLGLRPSLHSTVVIPSHNQDAYIKAVWSDQYIFNVRARSIFPCDVHGGGVPVLFQYPQCILQGDSVRLYSHHRADVASLAAPVKSEYVAEQHVQKGSHGLKFDCELFSERFIEYCFVYVSRAITDAMSNVRVDCVPTLPVSESDSGGWSEWSQWTACTSTCGGGTRNRFRVCDSPPPRYGAKFCQGEAVQSEQCGNSDWDCGASGAVHTGRGTTAEGKDGGEVSNVCRCGCVLHLTAAKPNRLLATSSHSCPGRALWVIQADDEHVIQLDMEYFRFPCRSQWLKIRDGDSTEANLIGEFSLSHLSVSPLTSTFQYLLLDFFSDEFLTSGHECRGEFQARAQQISRNLSTNLAGATSFSISSILHNVEAAPNAAGVSVVHGVVALFLLVLFLMTGCLGIQYVHRYRKYQLAAAAEDQDSLTAGSQGSLVPGRSRATSNSTLLSEVISMRRFAPMKCKHSRLREVDLEVDETADESSDCQRDENDEEPLKSSASQQTLKAASSDSSATPTPSPDAVRRSTTLALNVPASPCPEGASNTSSLDSTTSRGSSIAKLLLQRRQSLSSSSTRSASTLGPGCDSNSSSLRSNPKAKKDKRNRERLLAGSEFSLTGEADLEMDYYDYNVHNAAAVPESYIGMDPAYLVWIPPVSPVSWDLDNQSGSSSDNSPEKEKLKVIDENGSDPAVIFIKDGVSKPNGRLQTHALVHSRGRGKKGLEVHERGKMLLSEEKETVVEKSPNGEAENYHVIDDIKFADDDEEEMRIENSAV